ncbi:MAG: response regulator transcription factor [Candidatus Omnitrophica bacterium]|nr:response regulator transcription factor [Candidatus Omnitrophota bacterium]
MEEQRIILADDHEMFRQGLRGLIEKDKTFRVVAEARDGHHLLEIMLAQECEVVITDLSMPNLDGMSVIRRIHDQYPQVKILVLTMQKDHEHFKLAMAQGASGFILKEDAFEQLLLAIKIVLMGKQYVSSSVSTILTDRYIRSIDDAQAPSLDLVTRREKQILTLIAKGLANKNIAQKLQLSVRTVETHRANLTNKLGIKSTAGLVKYAISKGLI